MNSSPTTIPLSRPFVQTPLSSYFHVNEPLTKYHPSLKAIFPDTLPIIFPCKWTPHQVPFLKAICSDTIPIIFPCIWTSHQVPLHFQGHFFLTPFPSYFHANEPLTKYHPSLKAIFWDTLPIIFPCKWTSNQQPPLSLLPEFWLVLKVGYHNNYSTLLTGGVNLHNQLRLDTFVANIITGSMLPCRVTLVPTKRLKAEVGQREW